MDEEKKAAIKDKWRKEEFWPLIDQYNVSMNCIYNGDQTGLFYQKLPNTLYVDKNRKKEYSGAKQMKDKNRITLMVCTSASGAKCPLSIVGKAKKPKCFEMCPEGQTSYGVHLSKGSMVSYYCWTIFLAMTLKCLSFHSGFISCFSHQT